jgi:copper chaperone NosL
MLSIAAFVLTASCGGGKPDAIIYDADGCAYCRMQISDRRFGAVLVTFKGRTVKFDSIECLREYYAQANAAHDVASVWVSDFRHPGTMLDATTARFVDLGSGRAPMGRGWAAVASARDAVGIGVIDASATKLWSDLQ